MSGYWPRPAVLDRISSGGNVVIEASAGTGKTYTLEHLVIDLILRGGLRLDQILVVTFTEKAAAELSTRLRSAMARIHAGPWPADEGWRIDEVALRRLTHALGAFDAASISTIHAFCKRMLTEHAFVNGRLFREELVDARAVFQEAFLTVVRRTLATDPTLQPYLTAWIQRDSLEALAELLFEAHTRGAQLADPYDPVALQDALRDLTRMELTPAVLKPTLQRAGFKVPSVQAILNRVKAVRTVVEHFNAAPDPARALAALDEEERARRREGGVFRYMLDTLASVVDDIPRLAELHRAFQALDVARVPLASAVVQVALPLVRTHLHTDKRSSGRFDFDDLLVLVDEALRGPGQDALLATLRRRFKVALIDEFQDTDRVQWAIFKRVFADSPSHRLVVIGDPKQAIYGFRGADVQTYLAARRRLAGADTPVVHLTDTYRATPELAAALNRLLNQSRLTPFFTGAIRYDHPVRAAGTPPRLEIDGHAVSAVHVFDLRPRKDTLSPSAALRTLHHRTAEAIHDLLRRGTLVTAAGSRPASAADVFVLTRTAKEGLEAAAALRARGVPHAFYKQDGLFQTKEAQDVRNLLAAIADPHDSGRRLRAWLGPFFAVPLDRARHCLALPGNHPLLALLFRFRALADDKRWARLFPAILSDTGIIQRELLLSDSERELTNYLHIFEVLVDEALKSRGTLADLVQTMNDFIEGRRLPEGEDGNVQRLESERAAVQIMTMHKAKGLEAPIVFVTGGLDQNPGFAHVFHRDGQRFLHLGDPAPDAARVERAEEDQRLAYVALTRAQSRLYLPFYGGRGRPVLQRLTGTYQVIDRALESVIVDPEQTMLTVEAVREWRPGRERPTATTPLIDDATTRAVGTVARIPTETVPPSNVDALRLQRHGPVITSYSRLKESKGGYQPTLAAAADNDGTDDRARLSDPEIPTDHLPGGTASGRFVHEMLERVDLATVQTQASWSFWSTLPEVQALFQQGLRRYDRRPEHLPHSYQLVFESLTTPLVLGDLRLTDGVAGADQVIREMEFLYAAPRREDAPDDRGYVKGFIDVVLEHEGKVIVLDWKTDLLPGYDAKTLTSHVDANYSLQADLYTIALVRLLDLRDEGTYDARFAGTAYVFVRGLDVNGAGVYFTRPRWTDIEAAFDRLAATDLRG